MNIRDELVKVEDVDSVQRSPETPQSLAVQDLTEQRILQSRIDEQSRLIRKLKDRADEMLLRYQAVQKINSVLEDRAAHCQKELDGERKNAEMLKKRFTDLAANNQAIISFMEEHKNQNAQLKLENKRLQLENDSHFSQKLHDTEELVQKLTQDIELLKEKLTNNENEYREKLAERESTLREQAAQHRSKEALLLSQLHEVQQQHAESVENCNNLKLKLEEAEEQRETGMKKMIENLTKDTDKLLIISTERAKVIQDKQEEIQELETKWKEEKKARAKAEDRFALEAEAVNADLRVMSLQAALNESMAKIQMINKDFDAFKEHSANLLTQERDLNKKLRHLIG